MLGGKELRALETMEKSLDLFKCNYTGNLSAHNRIYGLKTVTFAHCVEDCCEVDKNRYGMIRFGL